MSCLVPQTRSTIFLYALIFGGVMHSASQHSKPRVISPRAPFSFNQCDHHDPLTQSFSQLQIDDSEVVSRDRSFRSSQSLERFSTIGEGSADKWSLFYTLQARGKQPKNMSYGPLIHNGYTATYYFERM